MRQSCRLLIVLLLMSFPVTAQAGTLAGSAWVLASAGKRAPAISFEVDGKVAGTGGCNRFFGSYEEKGEALSFSPLGATRMACPPEVMKAEQDFFAMLAKVRAAKVEASTLLLQDGAGKVLATLKRHSGQ